MIAKTVCPAVCSNAFHANTKAFMQKPISETPNEIAVIPSIESGFLAR